MESEGRKTPGITAEHELVAQMADGLVVVDPTGVICFANSAAHRLFGRPRDERMIGRLFGVPVVSSGVAEIELVSGTSVRLVEVNASKISWGATPAWLLVLRDVTVRKERERNVFRKGQEFEQLAYTVSHDLQEPLRTIEQLAVAYLEDHGQEQNDEARRMLVMMQDIATRGREMVRALVDYAALGSDKDTRVACSLASVFENACTNLGAEIERTQAAVVAETSLPTVVANPVYMVQLFQNLIGNALKFQGATPNPTVVVRASERQVDWRIDVCDDGPGIPEEQADYVFGVFAQLARSDAELGSKGLGLALCKKIVDYHGGSIWVDPSYERGCKISFTLPHEHQTGA